MEHLYKALTISPKMTVAELKKQLDELPPDGIICIYGYLDPAFRSNGDFRLPIMIEEV